MFLFFFFWLKLFWIGFLSLNHKSLDEYTHNPGVVDSWYIHTPPVPTFHAHNEHVNKSQHSFSPSLNLASESFSTQSSRQLLPPNKMKSYEEILILRGTSHDLGFCLSFLISSWRLDTCWALSALFLPATFSPGTRTQAFISVCCLNPAPHLLKSWDYESAAYLMDLRSPLPSCPHPGPPVPRWSLTQPCCFFMHWGSPPASELILPWACSLMFSTLSPDYVNEFLTMVTTLKVSHWRLT